MRLLGDRALDHSPLQPVLLQSRFCYQTVGSCLIAERIQRRDPEVKKVK